MQRKLGQALILCLHIELLKRSICILQETGKEHSELSVFTLVPLELLSVHINPSDVPPLVNSITSLNTRSATLTKRGQSIPAINSVTTLAPT